MRKLIIGLMAVGFVALLFFGYALIMDAEPITVQNVATEDALMMPESGDTVRREGDTDVRVAKAARYVVLDPETKAISRVFGFEKLLNQDAGSSRRQVEKPYMIFHESKFHCRIDADTGMFQVDPSGSNSMPKDARLNGNVKIHVTPKPGSKMSETIIEMDDLVFSSERSELATDRRVYIKSDQVELKGTGLIVIFDSAAGRIDYLRIRDLDRIRWQGLTDSKSETKTAKADTVPDTESASPTPIQQTSDSVVSSEKAAVESASPLRYYQCTLEDNVNIKYGHEIVIVGDGAVNIQNIAFSKLDQGIGLGGVAEQTKDKSKVAAKSSQPSDKKSETEPNVEPESEILVTCDGGIILKPMEENAEQMPISRSDGSVERAGTPLRIAKITPDSQQTPAIAMANLAGGKDAVAKSDAAKARPVSEDTVLKAVSDPNASPPAKFEARKIDYDLLTGSGSAHGPVRFTFYQPPDPNSTAPKSWTPITVTADEEALFIADSSQTIKQVVFSGNVMTTRTAPTPDFVQLDSLHSEKLTVDLDEVEAGKVDLSRLTVTEGKVYVQSQRTRGNRELSKVKLYCTEISYDKVHDVILAQGPGKIEMLNNEHAQATGSDPNNPMSRPCVAMVEDFMSIRWDMGKQSIGVDGDQETMKLAYYPILDGQIQKHIFVYSMRLEITYLPNAAGIKKVFTDKPIVYQEWNRDKTKRLHHITGQSLDYDAGDGDGWMKISGTPAVPCKVDGARMQEVFVHPVTGEIKASISTRPGVLKGR